MQRLDSFLQHCTDSLTTMLVEEAAGAALAAGRILRQRYNKPHQIKKKGDIDLVTEADLAAEEIILQRLAGIPDIQLLSEETHNDYRTPPLAPTWAIDPLDGTTNFAHGFPWFAVSIACLEQGRPKAGVIYHVMANELFVAGRGYGAWLNGVPITVSKVTTLDNALLATGFPYNIHDEPDPVINALAALLPKAQGVRRAGAAALDLAMLACGRLDGFWEINLKPWDTAAGMLLVEEAGGTLTDFRGGPYTPFIPELLASNTRIHPLMTALLAPFAG